MSAPATLPAGADVAADVLVVGAGVAGLVTALDVRERRPDATVVVVDKGTMGTSGSTPLAQGGMAAAVGADDSPTRHARDTLRAGVGLCDPTAVAVMTAAGPERVADLVARGAVFDRTADGAFALAREGGQSVARSVRAADASGAEIFRTLRRAAADARITRLQGTACALVRCAAGSPVVGAWVLADPVDASPVGPAQDGGIVLVRARRTVLATGGCGGLYAATTNRDAASGDGVALAYAAGAAVVDAEFVQFHPTALAGDRGGSRLLLTEALRGAGARLVDRGGRRFLVDVHPDAELAPRHVVTKAILDQPGGAWLDATGLSAADLAEEFPTVVEGVRRHGYELARDPVPVAPAEHYMIGGVATDLDGRTSLPGLSAAGEVACTGVHGANRMAGNSLLQSCVFGHRTALAVVADLAAGAPLETRDPEPPALADADDAVDRAPLRADLRRAMDDGAGPIRTATSLGRAAAALDATDAALGRRPVARRDDLELRHLVAVGRLVVGHARLRTESRGAHWRDDHPAPEPAWAGVHLRSVAPADARWDEAG